MKKQNKKYTPVKEIMREVMSDPTKAEDFKKLKERVDDISLKEAMSSSSLSDLVPAVFAEPTIELGLRSFSYSNFPRTSQGENNLWRKRRNRKNEGAQIIGESETVKQTEGEWEFDEYRFSKIADAVMFSNESLTDFGDTLGSIQREVLQTTSKIFRRMNQICSHRLIERSSDSPAGSFATRESNWINGPVVNDSTGTQEVVNAIKDGFLDMTTDVITGNISVPDTLIVSPQVWVKLFDDPRINSFNQFGKADQLPISTGTLPQGFPYGIRNVFWSEVGYFGRDGGTYKWVPQVSDMFLLDSQQSLVVRDRQPLSFTDVIEWWRDERGFIALARMTAGIEDYRAFRRISPSGGSDSSGTVDLAENLHDVRLGIMNENDE